MSDRLENMFVMQDKLSLLFGVDARSLTDEERVKRVLECCRAISQESAMITNCTPWKWWARYQQFDKENARIDAAALLHFLITLAQALEMSADDLYDVYVKVYEMNEPRWRDAAAAIEE